jgi:hypothetical protein
VMTAELPVYSVEGRDMFNKRARVDRSGGR